MEGCGKQQVALAKGHKCLAFGRSVNYRGRAFTLLQNITKFCPIRGLHAGVAEGDLLYCPAE